MSDDESPDRLYSRTQNLLVVVWVTAGTLSLAVLETAPPASRIGLLLVIAAVFLIGSLAAIVYLYQGGRVFGDDGIYPAAVAAMVGTGTFILTTFEVSSRQLTIAILVGVSAVAITSTLTVRAARS